MPQGFVGNSILSPFVLYLLTYAAYNFFSEEFLLFRLLFILFIYVSLPNKMLGIQNHMKLLKLCTLKNHVSVKHLEACVLGCFEWLRLTNINGEK